MKEKENSSLKEMGVGTDTFQSSEGIPGSY